MTARTLAKLFGTFHNVSYYAPEMKAFSRLGLREYWRAYMAYRSAPMGQVAASVVQSTFYNFSPAFVDAAIPSAWDQTNPREVMRMRDDCISTALGRALPDVDLDAVQQIVDRALPAITGCDGGARPLFAAHRQLAVPDDPVMRLWHTCTLWREYRGDGHNLALASANIDGLECHVLLAAKGVGNPAIIEKIRGWTAEQWRSGHDRLIARQLLDQSGEFTASGRQLRNDIEAHTDALCQPALEALGTDAGQVVELLGPLVTELIATGLVPGKWPPSQSPSSG